MTIYNNKRVLVFFCASVWMIVCSASLSCGVRKMVKTFEIH